MSHSNTPPVRNRAPLTERCSSLRCVSAAEHHTAGQYSKTGWTKPRKHLTKSDLSWNTRYKDFVKITSLWEAALETERRYFSKVILESNVTQNITNSTPSKIKFISIFYYMIDIKILQPGEGYAVGGGKCFFDRVTILFHQYNNIKI